MQFYIYSESGERIGVKPRNIVHRDGSWHRAVQWNLLCGDEILIQKRSNYVDIAKGLFDQTLATQLLVEDGENDEVALKRGMAEELGLFGMSFIKIAGPTRIEKLYDYDSSLWNREFVSLYETRIKKKINVKPISSKVESCFWMPVGDIKQVAEQNPDLFTKTFVMWLREAM